ncbi:MAG TPA: hypothetical protein VF756_05170 [Thermoanaerobaculia bacterium]
MDEHGIPGELQDEREEERSTERWKEIVRGLIRGDAACRAAVEEIVLSDEPSQLDQLSPELDASYDAVLDQAEDFARRAQTLPTIRERLEFRKALSLLGPGEGVLALADKGDMAVAGLGAYEAFLARSWAVRFDDPQLMCHLAKAAVAATKSLDPEIHGAQQVADYKARAWAELGNAYRAIDQFEEAAAAFKKAYEWQEAGTGDQALKARLLDLHASYQGAKREWEDALDTLKILPGLYHELGQPHFAGRALIVKALYANNSGNPEKAIDINDEGLALIDHDRDPELVTIAIKNHLLYLTDSGKFDVAWRLLFEHRPRFQVLGQVTAVKLRAIEGRINYGLGKLASAESIFREVKQGFAEHGLRFACALATLDLAITLMRQRRIDETEKEVLEAVPIFRSLDVQPEIYGCVILLEEAFRTRQADLELLENSVRYLRKKQAELGISDVPVSKFLRRQDR